MSDTQYESAVVAIIAQARQDNRTQPWKSSVSFETSPSTEEWIQVSSPGTWNVKIENLDARKQAFPSGELDARKQAFPSGELDARAHAFPMGPADARTQAFPMGGSESMDVRSNAFPVGDVNVEVQAFPMGDGANALTSIFPN